MLTAIEIENFKSIGEPVRIELAPITLLFGRNSAGKSTVLQALHYMRAVLDGNPDADRVEGGGEGIDLGGFWNLVHDRDLSKTVRIRIDFDKTGYGEPFPPPMPTPEPDTIEFWSGLLPEIESAWIEISVRWNGSRPYTAAYEVGADERCIARIEHDHETGECHLLDFDPKHPKMSFSYIDSSRDRFAHYDHILMRYRTKPWTLCSTGTDSALPGWKVSIEEEFLNFSGSLEQIKNNLRKVIFGNPETFLPLALAGETDKSKAFKVMRIQELAIVCSSPDRLLPSESPSPGDPDIEHFLQRVRTAFVESSSADRGHINSGHIPQGIEPGQELSDFEKGALERASFDWSKGLLETQYCWAWGQNEPSRLGHSVEMPLNLYMRGIGIYLRQELERLRHLGPLRAIPERNSVTPKTPLPGRWSSGLGAWDELNRGRPEFVREVGNWLGRLETGYALEADDSPNSRVRLIERESELSVEPIEIGVGISQVLPVVVAALKPPDRKDGPEPLVVVEQPELHVHPAVQVELGDLFACQARRPGRLFLIETHSEHLILRLLRRIEETHAGELPEGKPELRPEQVSVLYFERIGGQVKATRLRIDETGEFIDRWPQGFFEEQSKELF